MSSRGHAQINRTAILPIIADVGWPRAGTGVLYRSVIARRSCRVRSVGGKPMPERMLKFVRLPQQTAAEARGRRAPRRISARSTAISPSSRPAAQASRCSQCGVPFCSVHCPLGNNIPDWLKLTAEGRLRGGLRGQRATNNFPEICGRICPQDRLCEGNCVIEKGFESVTIGAVERYITDTALERGWVQADPAAAGARSRSASSAPDRPGWPPPSSCARGLSGAGLRPLRPGRRADDLRHPRLQAGEGGRAPPLEAAGGGRDPFRARIARSAGT